MDMLHGGSKGLDKNAQKRIDEQIDATMQKKEIDNIKVNFYTAMESSYLSRKAKEFITMRCARTCFSTNVGAGASVQAAEYAYNRDDLSGGKLHYQDDELSRLEKQCLVSCFHKTFKFLSHGNTVYTFLSGSKE